MKAFLSYSELKLISLNKTKKYIIFIKSHFRIVLSVKDILFLVCIQTLLVYSTGVNAHASCSCPVWKVRRDAAWRQHVDYADVSAPGTWRQQVPFPWKYPALDLWMENRELPRHWQWISGSSRKWNPNPGVKGNRMSWADY